MCEYCCEICGDNATLIELCGKYLVALCIDHRNDWTKYCRAQEEFLAIHIVGMRIEVNRILDIEFAETAAAEILSLKQRMFEKARAWVDAQAGMWDDGVAVTVSPSIGRRVLRALRRGG